MATVKTYFREIKLSDSTAVVMSREHKWGGGPSAFLELTQHVARLGLANRD